MKLDFDHLWLGTMAWAFDTWVGNFYPPKTKSGDYLPAYAMQFPAVEIDSTFYAIPRESVVMGWAAKTPDDFLFCPKFPQLITHEKRLHYAELETDAFLILVLTVIYARHTRPDRWHGGQEDWEVPDSPDDLFAPTAARSVFEHKDDEQGFWWAED